MRLPEEVSHLLLQRMFSLVGSSASLQRQRCSTCVDGDPKSLQPRPLAPCHTHYNLTELYVWSVKNSGPLNSRVLDSESLQKADLFTTGSDVNNFIAHAQHFFTDHLINALVGHLKSSMWTQHLISNHHVVVKVISESLTCKDA